jgi:hypothetical protein
MIQTRSLDMIEVVVIALESCERRNDLKERVANGRQPQALYTSIGSTKDSVNGRCGLQNNF